MRFVNVAHVTGYCREREGDRKGLTLHRGLWIRRKRCRQRLWKEEEAALVTALPINDESWDPFYR